MFIQIVLTIWLLALIFFTNKFRRDGRIAQQRIFSIFLIIWACLGVLYYDVWIYTSGEFAQNADQWQTYLPTVFFSICAGLGVYYFMLTFGKLRKIDEENQRQQDRKQGAKQKKRKK